MRSPEMGRRYIDKIYRQSIYLHFRNIDQLSTNIKYRPIIDKNKILLKVSISKTAELFISISIVKRTPKISYRYRFEQK
jgi:hypothetical protein